ncbi:MAG: hypothetical protein ACKV2Q_01690 [Planctomycetaceae bacterium]
MSALLSPQEPIVMDHDQPPLTDVGLAVPGDEFAFDFPSDAIDVSDLACQPLLASDLPLNSELFSLSTTAVL